MSSPKTVADDERRRMTGLPDLMRNEIEEKSFLIVDDFGDMRSMLKSMLSMFGVTRIDAAANGKEAVACLEKNDYDVILCDYNLGPGKDGQQILEEARHRQLIGVGSVFVMVTAENTREMVLGAVEYEPDNYLSKPFTKDLLRARLEKLLIRKKNLKDIEKAIDSRDYDLAVDLIDRKLAENPRNENELQKLKADICLKAGLHQQAADIYERMLAVRDIPWARLGLGKFYYATREYDKAREIFQDLVDDNPRLTVAYDWLAKIRQAAGDSEAAIEVLATAVELSPKAILRQKALGDIALKNHSFAVAEKAFSQVVRLGKHSVYKHPEQYAKLAKAKSLNGGNMEALKVIKQLEREFGNDKEASLYAAMSTSVVQANLGNDGEAQKAMEQADKLFKRIGTNTGPELMLEMAKAFVQVGQSERGKELFREVVRNNHADEDCLREIKEAYSELGIEEDPGKLIAEIKREIVALNNKGVELAKAGKFDDAIGLFEKAVEGMSGNKVINLNAARVLLMNMQEKGTNTDHLGKVRLYLDRVRKVDPDNANLHRVTKMYRRIAADA